MTRVRFIPTLLDDSTAPGRWAAEREAEGWDGVAVSDHVAIEAQTVSHVWVAATEMALATSTVTVATAFANNLMRSPVEFAHAALTLQRASHGRFEAGLGAGWDQTEMNAMGVRFPPTANERAGRYIEAVTIVRALFDARSASFSGEWYSVDIASIGPAVAVAPALVVSVGGPRTTAALTPLADVIEVKLPGFATTGKGSLYPRALHAVTFDHVTRRISQVRDLRPDAVIGLFLTVGCGAEPVVGVLRQKLEGSVSAGLFGEPAEVAATVRAIAGLGVSRVGLGSVTPTTYARLAEHLCGE